MNSLALPTELVTDILLSALPSRDPSHFTSSTYQSRITLLSNFSLACHAFKDIAEPILYSVFWARNKRQLEGFLESVESKDNAAQVHRLILAYDQGAAVSKALVMLSAKTLTHVKELFLGEMSLGDLRALNDFQRVETLTMQDVDNKAISSFTLPRLKNLTVGVRCAIELSNMKDKNAPRFSALALRRKTALRGWYPSLSSTSPWNLDGFVVDWYSWYEWQEPLPCVLVNYETGSYYASARLPPSLARSGVQHLRLYSAWPYSPYQFVQLLEDITEAIRNKPNRLETLILASFLDPSSFSLSFFYDILGQAQLASKKLSEECLARDVELMYEEQPDRHFDSDISKAFMDKMKRLALAREKK